MAELHVERKKNKLWWLWILVVLIIMAIVYFYILRNDPVGMNSNGFNIKSFQDNLNVLKAGSELMYA